MPRTRRPRGLSWLGSLVCATGVMLALTCQAAPLTEGEKQLLHGSVSSAAAKDYGHAASAEGLAKIIRLGDPALVRAFGHGLQQGQVSVLPPAVEALVIANFDHPTLGALLKGFQSRYQTRRLFDLHYARIATAYKTDDPSFSAIFNTDLAGIEEPLLRLAPKFPSGPRTPNAALMFLGQRKYAGAVPLLIAALEESYRPVAPDDPRLYSTVLQTLLAYPSVEVWRQTRAEIETLYRSGKIPAATHAAAARDLDSRLNDPPRALATIRWQEGKAAYTRKRDALGPTPPQIRTVRESDPRRYAREYRRYLEQLEQLAAEYPDQAELTPLATEYFGLGLFVRFTLKHPAEAVEVYSRAARYGHPLGHIAVADTYQFDLRDNARAADSYQRALDELPDPASPGFVYPYRVVVLPSGYARSRVTDWLKGQSEWSRSWLPEEIRYLRTGTPFDGRVSEAAIGGFFATVYSHAVSVSRQLEINLPLIGLSYRPRMLPSARDVTVDDSWSTIESDLARVDRRDLAQKLEALPASRLTLIATIQPLTALPDADSILRYLARNDPSGYWSTCLLGTAAFIAQQGEAGKAEAARNGTALLLPGLAGQPNALSAAATRFLRVRGLRVEPLVTPGR